MKAMISNKIKNIRKCNQLTQEEFAEELEISRTKVSSWERKKRNMTVIDAVKLANKFHISLDNFLDVKDISIEEYIEISDNFFKNKKISIKEKTKIINIIEENFQKGNIKEIYNEYKMTQNDTF
ncbi:MAG: helix-turn-helix transcriptional regulator [Clostridia bacterium]|nr:helix-turn-helix transcriptional regulator [Clostridia bacterium]